MSRTRLLSWGLILLATPAIAQWSDPSKPAPLPVLPPAQNQPAELGPQIGLPEPAPASPASFHRSGKDLPPERLPETKLPIPESRQQNCAAPAVVLEKRCPETVNVGATLTYDIIVRNVGACPVSLVRVEDELPAGTKYAGSEPAAEPVGDRLVWSLGSMEAGTERKLHVEVQPSAEGEFRSNATVSFSATAAMRSKVVCPKLAVTITGPESALSGEPVPFQIQVSNPGSGPVQNLVLRVKLPVGLQHPNGNHVEAELGALPAGETRTIPLRTTAAAGGLVSAEVSATGEGVAEAAAKADVQLLQPQLQIRRTGPSKILFKGEVTEEFEIHNPGNAPANNVTIVEVLPPGLEFIGASDSGTFDATSRSVTWKLGLAPAGARRTIALKTRATVVGDHPSRTVATADRGLEARADGVVAVEGVPALAIEIVALDDPIEVGGELTFEIRAFNRGSCPCTNIQIQGIAPEGLLPCDANGPTAGKTAGQQVTFEALPKLATKADAVFRIKVRAMQAGDFRFKVQMSCDELKLPVIKEEAARVYKN
ncbi:MAG: hypothetical protein ACJ8C4_19525 [Gemmataceae bacterium]